MLLPILAAALCAAVVALIYLAIANRSERRARVRAQSIAFRETVSAEVAVLLAGLKTYHEELVERARAAGVLLAEQAERERAAAEVRARVAERRSRALLELHWPAPTPSSTADDEENERTNVLPKQEARSC
jgi:2-phosphoglycerate kinase